MAIDDEYGGLYDDMNAYRRARDAQAGRIAFAIPSVTAANKTGGVGAGMAMARSMFPRRLTAAQAAQAKNALQMDILKQLSEVERNRLNGQASMLNALRGQNNIYLDVFKSFMKAHGIDPESGGGRDVVSSYDSAIASMFGSMGQLAASMLDNDVNKAAAARAAEEIFRDASGTIIDWSQPYGILDNLAAKIAAHQSFDPDTTHAIVLAALNAAPGGPQQLIKIINDSNHQRKDLLLTAIRNADAWAKETGAERKMVAQYSNLMLNMMEQLIARHTPTSGEEKSDWDEMARDWKKFASDMNLSPPTGEPTVDMEKFSTALGGTLNGPQADDWTSRYNEMLDRIEKAPMDLTLQAQKQAIMASHEFKHFKEANGLLSDAVAFKEFRRRVALKDFQNKQADRATLRRAAQGGAPPTPKPATAMVDRSTAPGTVDQSPTAPAPEAKPTAPAEVAAASTAPAAPAAPREYSIIEVVLRPGTTDEFWVQEEGGVFRRATDVETKAIMKSVSPDNVTRIDEQEFDARSKESAPPEPAPAEPPPPEPPAAPTEAQAEAGASPPPAPSAPLPGPPNVLDGADSLDTKPVSNPFLQGRERKPILPGVGQGLQRAAFIATHPSMMAQRGVAQLRETNPFKRDSNPEKNTGTATVREDPPDLMDEDLYELLQRMRDDPDILTRGRPGAQP